MSLPKCPNCGSGSVAPHGGVNRCLGCGYTGVVRDFHQPRPDPMTTIPTRGKNKDEPSVERRYAAPPPRMQKPRSPEPKADKPQGEFWWMKD